MWVHPALGTIALPSIIPSPYNNAPKSSFTPVNLMALPTQGWGGPPSKHPVGQIIRRTEDGGQVNATQNYLLTTNGQLLTVPVNWEGGRVVVVFNSHFSATLLTNGFGRPGTPLGGTVNINARERVYFINCTFEANGMEGDHVFASRTSFSTNTSYYFIGCHMQGHRGTDGFLHGDFFQYQSVVDGFKDLVFFLFTGLHNFETFGLVANPSGYTMQRQHFYKTNIRRDTRFPLLDNNFHPGIITHTPVAGLNFIDVYQNDTSPVAFQRGPGFSSFLPNWSATNQPPGGGLHFGVDPPGGDYVTRAMLLSSSQDPFSR